MGALIASLLLFGFLLIGQAVIEYVAHRRSAL